MQQLVWSGKNIALDTQGNVLQPTSEYQSLFNNLLTVLGLTLSNNGWQQTQQTHDSIISASASAPNGTFWIDGDNKKIVVKINNTLWATPALTAYS